MSNQDNTPTPAPQSPAEVCELLTKLILNCYQYPILEEQQEAVRQAIALITQGEKERERLEQLDEVLIWASLEVSNAKNGQYPKISGNVGIKTLIDRAIDAARAQPSPESK